MSLREVLSNYANQFPPHVVSKFRSLWTRRIQGSEGQFPVDGLWNFCLNNHVNLLTVPTLRMYWTARSRLQHVWRWCSENKNHLFFTFANIFSLPLRKRLNITIASFLDIKPYSSFSETSVCIQYTTRRHNTDSGNLHSRFQKKKTQVSYFVCKTVVANQ